MSRTIEAIMRHMTLPSNGVTNQRNGTEKLEKEVTAGRINGHRIVAKPARRSDLLRVVDESLPYCAAA